MLTEKWLLDKANQKLNVSGMNKTVAEITRSVIKEMYKKGIYVGVAQAYRSKAEQDKLYAKGRRGIVGEKIVTNAKGGQSNHNFGVAVDLFQYSSDGSEALFLTDTHFMQIVKEMKKHGMKWGGDWSSFKDFPHFEWYDAYRGEKPPTASSKPKPTQSTSKTHKVVSGDTLSQLALDYDTTVEKLKSWNKLKSSKIIVGDVLKVKAPATKKYHTVVSGDTILGIAKKYNISYDKIVSLNPQIKNFNKIDVKDKIRVK